MARETVRESDFEPRSDRRMKEGEQLTVILVYPGRKGRVVADAHPDDKIVKEIESKGTKQAARGRRPKTEKPANNVRQLHPPAAEAAAAAGLGN